ncbi:probable C-mannosyltransferase DPY19L3 isoform X1 [Macrobrachium nipponense]|uniref:probable C-mannosyltransferase DPY19L3 isoform X1 n=1 Tax=Macrobrachium nipponense TaxID=159736 RepID=UPI0030C7ABF0
MDSEAMYPCPDPDRKLAWTTNKSDLLGDDVGDHGEETDRGDYAEETKDSGEEEGNDIEKESREVSEAERKEGDEEEGKKKGVIDYVNDYLESIFTTCEEYDEEIEEELTAMYILLWRILSGTVGVVAIIVIINKYPQYLQTLHENQLWFSNIKEVEREISFRTEQGLYYSYYKQILQAPTWQEGIRELVRDNKTEYGRTINIIHRFNVLPEITLSAVYKLLKPQDPPILFYVTNVFRLHGLYLAALFMTSWYLSSSCLGGVITALLYFVHRVDTTRVNYTVPLRESFAVPLLFIQLLLLCTLLKSHKWQVVKMFGIFSLTVTFLLSWQFGPFVLLCQLLIIMGLGRLRFICEKKVVLLVCVIGGSLLTSCLLQSYPPMLVSSPALSMIVPAIMLSSTSAPSKRLGGFVRIFVTAAELGLMLIATVVINGLIKNFLNIDADSHVYQLLLAKLQMGDQRDFDSRIYMCNEAFMYLDSETVWRLLQSGMLPTYVLSVLVFGLSLANDFFKKVQDDDGVAYSSLVDNDVESEEAREEEFDLSKMETNQFNGIKNFVVNTDNQQSCSDTRPDNTSTRNIPLAVTTQNMTEDRPDLVFVLGVSILWSVLAILILRLKVIWLPTVCILSGVFVNDCRLYNCFFSKCANVMSYFPRWFPGFSKTAVSLSFGGFIIYKYWGQISTDIWPEEMYEFWDPDTVELMEWIQEHTPHGAVFAGSMQLLAGVKLCTGRYITNHPHYEDSWLRQRTHQIYHIYGRESPKVVHKALRDAGATYIILEDSICLAAEDPKNPLCKLIDLVDLHNGHVPRNSSHGIPGLKKAAHERFCHAVRYDKKDYKQFFSLVMSNKTFRVYRVAIT